MHGMDLFAFVMVTIGEGKMAAESWPKCRWNWSWNAAEDAAGGVIPAV